MPRRASGRRKPYASGASKGVSPRAAARPPAPCTNPGDSAGDERPTRDTSSPDFRRQLLPALPAISVESAAGLRPLAPVRVRCVGASAPGGPPPLSWRTAAQHPLEQPAERAASRRRGSRRSRRRCRRPRPRPLQARPAPGLRSLARNARIASPPSGRRDRSTPAAVARGWRRSCPAGRRSPPGSARRRATRPANRRERRHRSRRATAPTRGSRSSSRGQRAMAFDGEVAPGQRRAPRQPAHDVGDPGFRLRGATPAPRAPRAAAARPRSASRKTALPSVHAGSPGSPGATCRARPESAEASRPSRSRPSPFPSSLLKKVLAASSWTKYLFL